MAKIKCRYAKPYCAENGLNVSWSEVWWCDDDDWCPIERYERPKEADIQFDNEGNQIIDANPTCAKCMYRYGEFERSVQSYEYCEDGDLRIGRNILRHYEITYLEIDGRVLVETEGEE